MVDGEKLTRRPNENGPGTHSAPPKNRHAIGMLYATYWPVTTSVKIAPIARGPAKARRPRRSETKQENQTQFTGVCV